MASGFIASSLSGLQAAQLGLSTTEHNIANVNTPGFARQRTIQASNPGLLTGVGMVGQGTQVTSIERVYSRFLTEQVFRSQSESSEIDSYYAEISQIDNLLANADTGLSPLLQEFFASVQEVSAHPAQLSSREALLSTAQALSARYQFLGDQLAQIDDRLNGEITATVAGINSYAEQIAALNQGIGVAEASSGQPANDLRDSRERWVFELNKLIKATTTTSSDGSLSIFVGNGQQLVAGSQAIALTATPSASDPARLAVGVHTAAGVQEMPESLIKGGSLGGLLSFRREALDRAINDLGRNAASLALTFNAQSALGQDLFGQSSLSGAPTSFAPDLFAIAAPAVTAHARNPAGSPAVSAAFVNPPPFAGNFYTDLGHSDYRLSADAAAVTLTRLSDNRQWTAADLEAVNALLASDPQGFTLAAAGTLSAGASYLIQPTRNAATTLAVNPLASADPRLIAAAAPVRTSAGAANTGTATISPGNVGPGYPAAVAALPMTLVYEAGELRNFPAGAQVSINGGTPVVLADPADGIAYTSGASITLVGSAVGTPPLGFTFAISGLPNNGDTFAIVRNAGASADGRNALALAQLQTQKAMSGQGASFQEAYGQLVSVTGSRTHQAQVAGEAQQTLLAQAQASRDALSAVNLDEEAANLIRYQQAYQASARAMQIAASLFDTLLEVTAG